MPTSDIYDVAVIGYGPTGATAANLLGRLGLKVLVLERDCVWPSTIPGGWASWC